MISEPSITLYVNAVRDAQAKYNVALNNYLDAVLEGNATNDIANAWWKADAELKAALIDMYNYQQVNEVVSLRFLKNLEEVKNG